MGFSVATNFDPALVDGLKNFNVDELYGKLSTDFVGGGRSSYLLSRVAKRALAEHIAQARRAQIGFNYLLNSSCLGNDETTRSGQRKIRQLLDWVVEIGASATTLSNPLLLRLIKRHYPQLSCRVSVFAGIDHARKARYWEEMGADRICLDGLSINRDREALESLRASVKIPLELLVNGNCLASCALAPTHMNLLSHSSRQRDPLGGFVIDHCLFECSRKKMADPTHYLRSDWIRPEDLKIYRQLGYAHFKIVERNLPTALMLKRVQAYHEEHYVGNLIDLVQPYGHAKQEYDQRALRAHSLWRTLKTLFAPTKVRVRKLLLLKKLADLKGMQTPLPGAAPLVIDNQQLDGFLSEVFSRKCRNQDCDRCGVCQKWARRALTIDPVHQQKCLEIHQEIETALLDGTMWF